MECPNCSQELHLANCPGCGGLNPSPAAYCRRCGLEKPQGKDESPEAGPCPGCGAKPLPGSNFCSSCGRELPALEGEGPRLLTCASCGRGHLPADHVHCPGCGLELEETSAGDEEAAFDPSQRQACSDGNCIGIIGPDGRCTDCGKSLHGRAW